MILYHCKILGKDVKMTYAAIIIIFIVGDLLFLAICYSTNLLLGLICTVALIALYIVVFAAIGGTKIIQLLM